jgi:hypothetical protein
MPALVAHRKDRGGWGGEYDAAPSERWHPACWEAGASRFCLSVIGVLEIRRDTQRTTAGDQVISK